MMELFLPEQIALDGVSNALLGDVEETARRVNVYRPLPPDVVQRILDDLLGERVYASNAMEGNTLDLRETETILKTGKLIEKQRRESIEVRNLGEAVKAISALVPGGKSAHTVDTLRDIHTIVLKDDPQERGGRYRCHGVTIAGAKFQPPDHTLVAPLVDRVMQQLQKDSDLPAVVRAAWAHWAIARIHPFGDGNGRTARLWQDLVLFQGNLTCAIIRSEDRKKYLDALTGADEGRFDDLVQLVANRIQTTFSHYLVRIREDEKTKEFVREMVGDVEDRTEERKLEYLRWSRHMERIRFEFELLAKQFNDSTKKVRVGFTTMELVDQIQRESIQSGLMGEVSYFRLAFHVGDKCWHYNFAFSRHIAGFGPNLGNECGTCVRMTTETSQANQKALVFFSLASSPVSLREVFVDGNRFVVGMWNLASGQMEYRNDADPKQIAQDFFRDVFQYRLK